MHSTQKQPTHRKRGTLSTGFGLCTSNWTAFLVSISQNESHKTFEPPQKEEFHEANALEDDLNKVEANVLVDDFHQVDEVSVLDDGVTSFWTMTYREAIQPDISSVGNGTQLDTTVSKPGRTLIL